MLGAGFVAVHYWSYAISGTVTEAVAIVNSKDGKVRGIFKFAQQSTESPIEIEGIVDGLTPGNHGYHIHQYGNLSNGCQSTGAHYNPKGSKHGAPNEPTRHAGDMGKNSSYKQ